MTVSSSMQNADAPLRDCLPEKGAVTAADSTSSGEAPEDGEKLRADDEGEQFSAAKALSAADMQLGRVTGSHRGKRGRVPESRVED